MDTTKDRSYVIAPCEKGSSTYRVKRYRERAEELRTIADDLRHSDCQQTLLRLASSYDQMATQAAAMHEMKAAMPLSAAI